MNLPLFGLAAALLPGARADEPPPETRYTPTALNVRAEPSLRARIIGVVAPEAAFVVRGRAEGQGCGGEGWGALEVGYACLADTVLTSRMAVDLPALVAFDSPTPAEYRDYVATGAWPRDPASTEALLPYVYGKRWRHWRGHNWASLAAWNAGDEPVEALGGDRKYHFVEVVETPRGTVLVRAPDGKAPGHVVPLDDVFVYPVARFGGVDLLVDPLPAGLEQAWVHGYAGAAVYAAPGASEPVARLDHHAAIRVAPVPDDARWYRIPGGTAPDTFVRAADIRRVRPLPPPPDVGPDEVWLDVDTDQQVLVLARGARLERATLVSTGLAPNLTPHGLYRVLDKAWEWDMASLPGAAEPYHVERVPWVIHFRARYAIHGVFWHWGFGNRASHGCVNVAPIDARAIFDAVLPELPAGWRSVVAGPDRPGTTVRVRGDGVTVPDRR